MSKVKPFSRVELRRRRWRFLRRNAWRIGLVAAASLLVTVAVTWLMLHVTTPDRATYYVVGCFHAAAVASFLFLIESVYLAHDAEAIKHVRGAWGEDNTRDVLSAARRRRLIWDWVDSISLEFGDIDHLVVTRRAGVIAMDSKWWSEVSDSGLSTMARSAQRAAMRAQGVLDSVLTKEPGARHRARTRSLTVRPLVVVWGAAAKEVGDGVVIEGVPVVAGPELRRWLSAHSGQDVDKAAARDAVKQLERYRDRMPSRVGQ